MSKSSESEALYFLYGSETGNAESIAKRLHLEATKNRGYTEAVCMSLNQAVTKKLLDQQCSSEASPICLVIICSTTGEGEPPQNAIRFRRWLRSATAKLHYARFTVLALGDTNYNNFCAPGILIDNKLEELGGVRCYPRGEADDGVGLDLVVDPWTENIWENLAITTGNGTGEEKGKSAVGKERYASGEVRVDMSVAQEAAIIYSNGSRVCTAMALQMYERACEFGGRVDLYPIQFFDPSKSLVRAPKILLLILCAESDPYISYERCPESGDISPCIRGGLCCPLGAFLPLFSSSSKTFRDVQWAEPQQALLSWLSSPTIRFFNSVCILPRQSALADTVELDKRVMECASYCKLELLCRRQGGDSMPSIAADEKDGFEWCAGVLDSLPGVTVNLSVIRQSLEIYYQDRVGAAFVSARQTEMDGENDAHNSNSRQAMANGTGWNEGSYGDVEKTSNPANGSLGNTVSNVRQVGSNNESSRYGQQELHTLLTPFVFLYTDHNRTVKQIGEELQKEAASHHLRSSLFEMSGIRQTGFPRRAIFVFLLAGSATKVVTRVLKSLQVMQNQGKTLDGVRFAVLGIDRSSQSDRFNACALELETLLVALSATKIHCTGLADIDSPRFLSVVRSWESTLWGSLTNPTPSVAYLDVASPTIQLDSSFSRHRSTNMLLPEALGGKGASGEKDSGTVSLGELGAIRGAENNSLPLISPTAAVMDFPSASSHPASASDPALGGPPGTLMDVVGTASRRNPASLFPWESVPLNMENVPYTPLAFFYSSSGMAKTMAVHALQEARKKGFPVSLHSFSNYSRVDFHQFPNMILFCECGPDGQSNGGRRFKKFLMNPSHAPDDLSFVRFAVLGLGVAPQTVAHPSVVWASMLSRLGANRVFPVALMSSMSQLYSLGMPWFDCVCASMALQRPARGPWSSATSPSTATSTPAIITVCGADCATAEHAPAYRRILIMYGSSTGITESIARDLHREALERGYYSRVAALKYFMKMSFLSTENILIVCSTIPTSPGGLPRNARKFVRYICSKGQPATLLSQTSFGVLGLGNGRASTMGPVSYCRAAVRIDAQLEALGGSRLCSVGLVDAAEAIAEPVEVWRRHVFSALDARLQSKLAAIPTPSPTTDGSGPLGGTLFPSWNHSGDSVQRGFHRSDTESGASHSVTSTAAPPGATSPTPSQGPPEAKPRRLLLAYTSPPGSVVPDIAQHLLCLVQDSIGMVCEIKSMNDLMHMNWRHGVYDGCVFLVSSSDEGECPFNGSLLLRLLRQRTTPADFLDRMPYTVLSISSTNSPQFYLGRHLDRRLEEVGGRRIYARGEAIDSYSLERAVERWINGLLSTLADLCEELEEVEAGKNSRIGQSGARLWDLDSGPLCSKGIRSAGSEKDGTGSTEATSSGNPHNMLRHLHRANQLHSIKGGRDEAHEESAARKSPRNSAVSGVAGGAPQLEDSLAPSSQQDERTENTLLERIAFSPTNGGDRVDGLLHSWKLLTGPLAELPVVQLNLCVTEKVAWQPGQSVSILPANCPQETELLLRRLGVSHMDPFHPLTIAGEAASIFPNSPLYSCIDFPVSCGTVLLRYVDLRLQMQSKYILQVLDKATTDEAEKARLRSIFDSILSSRTPRSLLEVLQECPSCRPSFRHIVEHLTPLKPRQYSICSSHAWDPRILSLCVKIAPYGVCTQWLWEQCVWAARGKEGASTILLPRDGDQASERMFKSQSFRTPLLDVIRRGVVPVREEVPAKYRVIVPFVLRSASEFRAPKDPLVPLILIGPGTGIAPFRAFLQERAVWISKKKLELGLDTVTGNAGLASCPFAEETTSSRGRCGSIDVFYGCRRRDEDFLYADDFADWESSGVMHSLHVAYSRDVNDGGYWYGGCYVQDKLEECGMALVELLLQRSAHIFVCGDAGGMAKEVQDVLTNLIRERLSLSEAAATDYVDSMIKDGRYVREVWTSAL